MYCINLLNSAKAKFLALVIWKIKMDLTTASRFYIQETKSPESKSEVPKVPEGPNTIASVLLALRCRKNERKS